MKLVKFFPLILLTLTACQQAGKIDSKASPTPVAKEDTKEEVFEGSSGLVHIKMVEFENDQLTLPNQIKVTIEKPSTTYSNFVLAEYPDYLTKFLFATNDDTVTFGCHPEDATTLPLRINAHRVVLCGKVKIPSGKFEVRASILELRDAEIVAELDKEDVNDLAIPSVMIYTAEFIVSGRNQMTLQGHSSGVEREAAPALFFNIGRTTGDGELQILSRKYIKLMR